MKRFLPRLTYANVISTLCLCLLLGGGAAFAANKLAKNSVGAKQLKKNSVTGSKVKNGSLTGADIRNGSLNGAKIDASTLGQVPSAKTAGGALPTGSAGGDLTGAFPNPTIGDGAVTGAKLAPGIPHDVHYVSAQSLTNSEPEREVIAKCPAGEKVVGGGAIAPLSGATGFVALSVDGPREQSTNSGVFDEWVAKAIEVNGGSAQAWAVQVVAVCGRF